MWSFHNRVGVWNELKVLLFYLENWLGLSLRGNFGVSTAVISDLNIEVKIFPWLRDVRPCCGQRMEDVAGTGCGLHGVHERHERIQLVICYFRDCRPRTR